MGGWGRARHRRGRGMRRRGGLGFVLIMDGREDQAFLDAFWIAQSWLSAKMSSPLLSLGECW